MISGWMFMAATLFAVGTGVAIWLVRKAHAHKRSGQIEVYLHQQKQEGRDEGRCSVSQLMSKLRMTKSQVLEACRLSPAIMQLATTANFPGAVFADTPVFEYAPLRGRL